MKKIELIKLTMFSLILSISLIITSCEQDPVTPPSPDPKPEIEDSNFFDWHLDTVYNILIRDFFVCDTHTAVLAGNLYGIIHKNGEISKKLRYLDKFPAFGASSVNGSDENNVYFGGEELNENREMLIHWNGADFKEIMFPERIPGTIVKIDKASGNDYWLTSSNNKGMLYRYNNFVMSSYYFDVGSDSSISTGSSTLITEDNKIYAFAGKTYSSAYTSSVYLFNGNTFDFIRKDSVVNNNGIPYGGKFSIKNDVAFGSRTGLYILSGNEYVKFLDFRNLIFFAYPHGAGESLTNFMFLGRTETGNQHLFYVQGNKFYRQSGFWVGNLYLAPMFYKYGRYYMLDYDWDFYYSRLITGTPKKQFLKN